MGSDYKKVRENVRQAFAKVQSGAMKSSAWKKEGPSSRSVQVDADPHSPRGKPPRKVAVGE